MKLAFALVATIAWTGCGIDTAAPGPGGDDGVDPGTDPGDDPGTEPVPVPGTGQVTEVSGHITANTTWKDTIHVIDSVIIDRGVTVTVAPGTVVNVDVTLRGAITVSGVLAIGGTKQDKVTFQSAAAGTYWLDIAVPPGGVLTASYLVQTGGGLTITGSGKATLVDTQMSHVRGDFLTMSGGTLEMTYSAIGIEVGRDTIHCDMHVGNGPTIRATHSNLTASSFGIMFYGGVNADFTYNNWFGNANDVVTTPTSPVTGDFSYSYFKKGNPTNAGITATNMATARIADAGVR
jgi:hypothetical protein